MTAQRQFGGGSGRPLVNAMRRGLGGTCPSCGRGRLFYRYLKVVDICGDCGEELHHQRADDAPPYFTMLLVGHIIVPLALLLERIVHPATWVHMALWLPATVALVLLVLPRVKGTLIGMQWSLRMHGFGGETDLPA